MRRHTPAPVYLLLAAGTLTLFFTGPEVRSASPPSYIIHDLGTLGGDMSQGSALPGANRAIVAGTADTQFQGEPGPRHAFVRNLAQPARGARDIGTLKLTNWNELYAQSFDDSISVAHGINDLGHVVGHSSTVNYRERAFFWSDLNGDGDGRQPLANGAEGPLDPGPVAGEWEILSLGTLSGASTARSINNRNEIVGTSETGGGIPRAVLWTVTRQMGQPSRVTLVELPPADPRASRCQAFGINSQNPPAIVGSATKAIGTNPQERAVRWRLNRATGQYGLTDLGVLPGHSRGIAHGVNDAGAVVGVSSQSNGSGSRAFRWIEGGGMQNLGTLPRGSASVAYDINASGAVVGYATTQTGERHAFLYVDGLGMIDLNTRLPQATRSDWVLQVAQSISDDGTISGSGLYKGKKRSFLLTLR